MPQESIELNPDTLKAFARDYMATADAWKEASQKLNYILEQFDAEAAKLTRTGNPMPVTKTTREILHAHLSGVVQAMAVFSSTIEADARGMGQLAHAFEENEGDAQAAINAVEAL